MIIDLVDLSRERLADLIRHEDPHVAVAAIAIVPAFTAHHLSTILVRSPKATTTEKPAPKSSPIDVDEDPFA